MRRAILDLGELPCVIDVSKLNPGPSGEDADAGRSTSRCRITYPAPGVVDRPTSGPKAFLSSWSGWSELLRRASGAAMRSSIMSIQHIRPGIPGELHDPFDRRAFVCAVISLPGRSRSL